MSQYRKCSTDKFLRPALEYAETIASGELKANRVIRRQCERFLHWLENDTYEFRVKEARRAVDFFQQLRHVRGPAAGEPFSLLPWQCFAIANIFGWYQDDKRLIKTAFISVARKNGKSTLGAGLALKLLVADSEPGPQVMCAATSREQARIVLSEASSMVASNPYLRRSCSVFRSEIRCPGNNGLFFAASADASRLWGYNLSGAVIDELHAHKDRSVWDSITTSMLSRERPLLVVISTAGEDQSRLFTTLREYTAESLDTDANPSFFGLDYYLDVDDIGEENWILANPSLGYTLSLDNLREIYAVLSKTPSGLITFKRYHLNLLIENANCWIPEDVWNRNTLAEPVDLAGRPCFVGLDVASSIDLAAIVAIVVAGDYNVVVPRVFTCEAALESDRGRLYREFVSAGLLTVAGKDTISQRSIVESLRKDFWDRFRVQKILFDPAYAFGIVEQLRERGIPEHALVEVPQSARVIDPILSLVEQQLYENKLKHHKNALLDYCLRNTVISVNNFGQRRLSKAKSTGPIDPIVAMVLAAAGLPQQKAGEVGIIWV